MKFIAHRGACLERQEDTLEALLLASKIGADVVECDPRKTKDGVTVIFHDDDLNRLADDNAVISEITYKEMKEKLEKAGKTLTTLDDIINNYNGKAKVLLDMCFSPDDDFLKLLSKAKFEYILGIHKVEECEFLAKRLPPEQILAFMEGREKYSEYAKAGAGIIRLWENWLDNDFTIKKVKDAIPKDKEVWIMSSNREIKHPLYFMNSSPEQIDKLKSQGADGILLNDIRMAVER